MYLFLAFDSPANASNKFFSVCVPTYLLLPATGNVEAGDTEVGGKKVYLFIQCQDGKKMVHALFVGERGILEGLCLLCACLQAKQQRENEE